MKKFLILFALVFSASAYADKKTSWLEYGAEHALSEIAAFIMTLPGFDYIKQKISDNRYEFVSSASNKGTLIVEGADHQNLTLITKNNVWIRMPSKVELPTGVYRIASFYADPDKQSQFPRHITRQIYVPNGDWVTEEMNFYPLKTKRFPFTVNTGDKPARVRIMNIVEKYYDGIPLQEGKYDIEITFLEDKQRHRVDVFVGHDRQVFNAFPEMMKVKSWK